MMGRLSGEETAPPEEKQAATLFANLDVSDDVDAVCAKFLAAPLTQDGNGDSRESCVFGGVPRA